MFTVERCGSHLFFASRDPLIRDGTGFILEDSMESMLERLGRFRHLYPPRRVRCGAAEWEYFAGGKGIECLLLLHGGSGSGEVYFEYFLDLADAFRLIAPTIPADVTILDEVVSGFAAILDTEGLAMCNVFGHSQGGIMALEFSERKPQRVKTLILSSC